MREGWTEFMLGDLVEQRADFTTVEAEDEYVVLGVQRSGWGFVEREPIRGQDQKFTKLMKVEQGNLVYRTITAFEAPAAVAGPEEDGLFVTPQTFPVFQIDVDRLLPGYMKLLTTWPGFHKEMASRCTGTVLRRKTLSARAFKSIPIKLPPMDEQQRVVDLIGSVDDVIDAAEDARRSLILVLNAIAYKASSEEVVDMVASVADIQFGKAFRSETFAENGILLLRGDNIAPGKLRWKEAKRMHLASLTSSELAYALKCGDLVLGMDRPVISDGVRAAVVGEGDLPSLLVQRVARLRFSDSGIAKRVCAYWRSSYFSARLMQSQTGSHVPHLSAKQIRSWSIPSSIISGHEGFAISAVQDAIDSVLKEGGRLRALRSNLLAALLSGEHEIPAAYDELLEEKAA